jgi:hypothetical protein
MATSAQTYDRSYAGYGWVSFAGIMLVVVGFFNVIDGIVAISKSDYLVNQLLFANLHEWGWFFLIWGIVQVCVGFAIMAGSTWVALVGVLVAFVNLIAQLSWARVYPVWSVSAMVVDVLAIYGLIVYGGRHDT